MTCDWIRRTIVGFPVGKLGSFIVLNEHQNREEWQARSHIRGKMRKTAFNNEQSCSHGLVVRIVVFCS